MRIARISVLDFNLHLSKAEVEILETASTKEGQELMDLFLDNLMYMLTTLKQENERKES